MKIERHSQRSLNPNEQEMVEQFQVLVERYVSDGILTHEEWREINDRIYAIPGNQEVTFRKLCLVQKLVWQEVRSRRLAMEL